MMRAESVIKPELLNKFRTLIYDELGICISHEKDYILKSKLNKILIKSGYASPEDLFRELKRKTTKSFEDLVRFITTGHTFFFREKKHLEILREDIISRGLRNPVIWCAATSTGEEVYSIILEFLEHNILDFFIVASDINKDVLIKLKMGIYSRDRLKEIDKKLVKKYFLAGSDKKKGYYKVKQYLKNYFIVKKLNLIQPIFFKLKFDYILCRNVLIYFDKKTQKKAIENLLNNLKDNGYLFVGHSETLFCLDQEITPVFPSVYRKKS